MAVRTYLFGDPNGVYSRRSLYVADTLGDLEAVTYAQLWEEGIVGSNTYRWNGATWEVAGGGGSGLTHPQVMVRTLGG